MRVGQHWAYRVKVRGPVSEVRIDRLGTSRPPRVRVTFVDDEHEGRSDWVPVTRLKIEWDNRERFLEHEAALDRLASESEVSGALDGAARYVLDRYVDHAVAHLEYNYLIRDILTIKQPHELAAIAGMSDEAVLSSDGFWDDEGYRVGWATVEQLVRAVVRRNHEELALQVQHDEEVARLEEVNGSILRGRGGTKDSYIEPEHVASSNREFVWPVLRVLREWLGIADPTVEIQMRALREAGERATYIAELAIGDLRDSGQSERAWRLHRMLFPNATKRGWKTADEIEVRTAKERDAEARRLASEWSWERNLDFEQRVADLRREIWGE
jgi:hypothetical protein